MKKNYVKKWFTALLPLLLCGCMIGPTFVRPTVDTSMSFKEQDGWMPAQAQDLKVREAWWTDYDDPILSNLIEQVDISNQSLAEAEARFRQAQALVGSARAGLYPSVGVDVSASRSSANQRSIRSLATGTTTPTTTTTTTTTTVNEPASSTTSNLNLRANWEIDLWGRVRRIVESRQAGVQASAADLAAVRLSAQTDLAQNYFSLRSIDTQKQLLERTLRDYERAVTLTQNQYDAGIIAKGDLILAQTQLKSTQAQAIDLEVRRAELEHAIALLIGKAPSALTIVPAELNAAMPNVPVSLPSALLERRPDIAAAERRVAAANAEIGVAKTAYFPRLALSASGGAQSSGFADLLSLPNRFWSLGPALAATLFDGGLRRADVEQAGAAYDGTVAIYRQTVLNGFREVEDNLAALRILEREAAVQDEAVQLSRRSAELANNQYRAGIVSYLNVIQVQATALGNERTALDIRNRRLAASVLLIKALGGGWVPPPTSLPLPRLPESSAKP
ncbi:MAG: efflux transporter outer membrane subunit [Pseudomonadota bacterium]